MSKTKTGRGQETRAHVLGIPTYPDKQNVLEGVKKIKHEILVNLRMVTSERKLPFHLSLSGNEGQGPDVEYNK